MHCYCFRYQPYVVDKASNFTIANAKPFHAGKLTLKIPWKNLYSAPVEAAVENLYLLVVPNTEIKYDPAKEEKWKQDAKQAEINKVEEAKKQEREKSEFLFVLSSSIPISV